MIPDRTRGRGDKATLGVALFFGRILWLFCLILLFFVQSATAQTWHTRVVEVLDGDTVVLEGGERLRLRGVDAPEVRHGRRPGQFYGQEARKELQTLLGRGDVLLDRIELGTDRYGRLVGVAHLPDGRCLNVLLVVAGAAFAYPHASDKNAVLAEEILRAQRTAIAQSRGFWPKILSLPAARDSYVGTRSSKRFHRLSCATGRKVKKYNQIMFPSLRAAFEAGFSPARECTPWPRARSGK